VDNDVIFDIFPLIMIILIGGLVYACYSGGERLQYAIEGMLAWVSRTTKQTIGDYVDVETIDNDTTFVLKDGSAMTVVKVHGTYQLIGEQEFAEIDHTLARNLSAYMQNGGHDIHVVFNDDPDSIERIMQETIRPSVETAERLHLDLKDLFAERVRTMSESCSHEAVYLLLITRPKAVSKHDLKQDLDAKLELLKANPLPNAVDAPNFFRSIHVLRTRHSSYVTQFLSDLRMLRIDAEVMEVHDACREMRSSADPDFTDENWRARLFGDKIPFRNTGRSNDVSGWLWPRLDSQLIPRDPMELDLKTVEVGDRIYAPMHITLQPADIKPFAALFRRVRETRMPWRITFRIASGGLSTMSFKNLVGALFGWTSKDNSLIEQGINYVKQATNGGMSVDVAYRVDFMTWAPKGEMKLLKDRAARLARAVQGWGTVETAEVAGDVHEAFVANCPGMRLAGTGPISCAPIEDVTPMLPLYRPASPWRWGAMQFRTPDGKMYFYQPNSPVQSSWIALLYAEMRSGKSVMGNQTNLALCLSPGLVRLPLIAIVDIGRASAGLISVLYHALPEHLRYLVASIRLRMTSDYAVNPLDTQLGARYPLPQEKIFHRNFIMTLLTPPGQPAAEDGMAGLAESVLEYAFKYYAEADAKRYVAGQVRDVDQGLAKLGIQQGEGIDERTTWWEVVDALFEHGEVHLATIAQRYAMPLLTDIASMAREQIFTDTYGKKKLSDDEPLQNAFARRLSEAIRLYPILAHPTRFDIGLARVVSIDLDEVAKSGSSSNRRQTAMVYMLARHITARNFFLHTDDVPFFPTKYQEYQERRIREIMQDKKHLQYDEFHVTDGVESVRDQVVADMRVTGKLGVMVSLISQSIDDFDSKMLEFASTKIVLSRANKTVAEKMQKVFGMTQTVEYAVQREIRPPTKGGATFLAMFKTKATEADAVQLLRNPMGGIELWGFSTTNEDAFVRDELYKRLGPTEARRFLATLYPGGSVLDEIERRKQQMSQSVMLNSQDNDDGVIQELIDDLLSMYESSRRQTLTKALAA
jgi:intracellular multiplication protein IcmB